ncbi:MAG: guanylate kinase, partial [Proteobacteria bacterium]|nr:guanylate kinase [Pseudomonadota bacterium]
MLSKFLLLLGVSGVGKSTLIRELKRLDERFIYISPYMTRPLREGESDKIEVSNEEMDLMISKG